MSRNFNDEIREASKLRQLITNCQSAHPASSGDVDDLPDLFRRAQNGDDDARISLIGIYFPLLKRVTMLYHLPGIDPADILQEGMLGLMLAIAHCDLGRIGSFTSYAEFWIRRSCGRFVYLNHQCIRQPVQVVLARRKVQCYDDESSEAVSCSSAEQCHKEANIRRIAHTYIQPPISLELLQESDQQWEPQMPVRDEDCEQRLEQDESLYTALDTLDARSRSILIRLFGLDGPPQSLRALARDYHLSAERIRQIKAAALETLRARMVLREMRGTG